MAKTRAQKEDQLVVLTEKVRSAKSLVFTDYRGLTMSQLSNLRNVLVKEDAQLLVTKNTLMSLALKDAGITEVGENIKSGPTATLFSFGDEISPLKALVKALKEAGLGKIKGGFLDNSFLDEYSVTKLSTLPSKQELHGKTVSVLAAPLQGMVGVLQANLHNLVYALDQIKLQRGGE